MKNMKTCLKGLLAGFLLTAGAIVYAADVAVIVQRSNPEALSMEQIKNIYSDHRTTWRNGQTIEIFNLPTSQEARGIFARQVLGVSGQAAASAVARRKMNNTVKNPPNTKSERLVVLLVARQRNAIGYVPLHLVKGEERVRIVKILKDNE